MINRNVILVLLCLFINVAPIKGIASSSLSVANTVQKALPTVVFIAIETNPFDLSCGPNPGYFYEFFRPFYETLWPPMFWHGSGCIISADGYVVTCAHVVEHATSILVALQSTDRRICKASLVGSDPRTDIAVLKIENNDDLLFPYLQFGNSSSLQVGEQVILIGSPEGSQLESTVTMGIVSAKDRNNFNQNPVEGYIQTDTVVNHGNSGGPLLNLEGDVIGLISWQYSHFFGREGLSFAIPSKNVQLIANQIIAKGKVSQGFLGIELDQIQESVFDEYYFDGNNGARITRIIQNSPAEKARLEIGDFIIGINGDPIKSSQSLRNQIAILEPNTTIHLTIDRLGNIMQISVKLGSEELLKAHWASFPLVI